MSKKDESLKKIIDKIMTNNHNFNTENLTYLIEEAFNAGWNACFESYNDSIEEKEILNSIIERLKKSKQMPADFSKVIDEEFWDIVN